MNGKVRSVSSPTGANFLRRRLPRLVSPGGPKALEYYRDLIWVLVAKELKIRYKSTVLGYAWSLLHPLAFAMVFFVLFRVVMRFNIADYALFLISALFAWHWLVNSVAASTMYFLGNRCIIRKVRFRRDTLVVSGVLIEMMHFVASLPIILLFVVYYGRPLCVCWLWCVPLCVIIQFTLTMGLGLLIATCNLFLRDIERLTRIVMHLMFYLTPVLYPIDRIPESYTWVLYANPFASIMVCWHALFYEGAVPYAWLAPAAAWGLACLILGYAVYARTQRRFAEIV